MITERLQHIIDELAKLPPEEQDRVADAIQAVMDMPRLSSEWQPSVERVMQEQADTLEYLKDK